MCSDLDQPAENTSQASQFMISVRMKHKTGLSMRACVLILSFCLLTPSPAPANTLPMNFSMENPTMFRSPSTPKDVLLNIKHALENDLFVQEAFYTAENFRWFIGQHEVLANDDSHAGKKFVFPAKTNSASNSCIQSGGAVWFDRQKTAAGSIGVRSSFGVFIQYTDKQDDPRLQGICTQFNADTMQEVFGTPTEINDHFPKNGPPPLHGRSAVFGAKTHSLGQSDIDYDFSDSKIFRKISFEIIGNGMIRSIGVESSQRVGEYE
jgi:hypothetical protein